jgi:voltage-gated potassium channel
MPFLYALGLTSVTVVIHALGTLEVIAHLSRVWQRKRENHGSLAAAFLIVRVVAALLLLHVVEAGAWAGFFLVAKLLPDMDTAVYFSLTSYTTVGYGDVVLPPRWRVLGPIEAAVGILMFGWSTAIMVAAITRVYGGRLRLQTGATGGDIDTHHGQSNEIH